MAGGIPVTKGTDAKSAVLSQVCVASKNMLIMYHGSGAILIRKGSIRTRIRTTSLSSKLISSQNGSGEFRLVVAGHCDGDAYDDDNDDANHHNVGDDNGGDAVCR